MLNNENVDMYSMYTKPYTYIHINPHGTRNICVYVYGLISAPSALLNTLRPRQNWRHFADFFKCIFLNNNVWISLKISLEFIPKFRIDNIPALIQIKVWHRPGDKSLSEKMMVSLLMHKCITRVYPCGRWTPISRFTYILNWIPPAY